MGKGRTYYQCNMYRCAACRVRVPIANDRKTVGRKYRPAIPSSCRVCRRVSKKSEGFFPIMRKSALCWTTQSFERVGGRLRKKQWRFIRKRRWFCYLRLTCWKSTKCVWTRARASSTLNGFRPRLACAICATRSHLRRWPINVATRRSEIYGRRIWRTVRAWNAQICVGDRTRFARLKCRRFCATCYSR